MKTWRIWLHKKKYCLPKMLFKKPKVSEYGKIWKKILERIHNIQYVCSHFERFKDLHQKMFSLHKTGTCMYRTICWKFQILEVIISIKNIIFIKKYIQCSLGLLPPVLSPNSPIAKILVCPDLPHYKYLVILPNSATAIRHSFSDTKVVKPI